MSTSTSPVIGIIGGSGLYQMDGLKDVEWREVGSPFGEPSDALCFGTLEGHRVVFLPRHGRGHRLAPTDINFRANIDALKRSGVTDLLSLSAVGGLREEFPPGTFVVVDQFIDRTFAREKSFFGTGLVGVRGGWRRRALRARAAGRRRDGARPGEVQDVRPAAGAPVARRVSTVTSVGTPMRKGSQCPVPPDTYS